jgi:methylated-DNA-[protein]-cysteine S-methyltransferase
MVKALSSIVVNLPFGAVQLFATEDSLIRLDFLAAEIHIEQQPQPLLLEAQRQLLAYCNDARFQFDLPYALAGTEHQLKVWQQIAQIGSGRTRRYQEIAQHIHSSPRAVGGACGRNPIPLIVPCHRVVAANGLGGFNANRNGLDWMPIKRWLLQHEGILLT